MAAYRLNVNWSAVDSWKNLTRQDLRLSKNYMENLGIDKDDLMFAVVFGYFKHIAKKIIGNESNLAEKFRLIRFFERDLTCMFDGFGLRFQEIL